MLTPASISNEPGRKNTCKTSCYMAFKSCSLTAPWVLFVAILPGDGAIQDHASQAVQYKVMQAVLKVVCSGRPAKKGSHRFLGCQQGLLFVELPCRTPALLESQVLQHVETEFSRTKASKITLR